VNGLRRALQTVLLLCLMLTTQCAAAANTAVTVWMSSAAPGDLIQAVDRLAESGKYRLVGEAEAQLKLIRGANTGIGARWLYVPVVPFPTVADNMTLADLIRFWAGDGASMSVITGGKNAPTLFTTPSGYDYLQARLGTAPAATVKVEILPAAGIKTALWLNRPNAWAFVPFESLEPSMKVLTVDGQSIFDNGLDIARYPFADFYGWTGDPPLVERLTADLHILTTWPEINRDPARLTTLVMTGVTALTRATAYEMERTGITLPARDILPFLEGASIIHTSNEVSFTADCPYPRPRSGVTFCSRDTYFDLLKHMRLSVVELTGNHGKDYGAKPFLHSLDLYEQAGISYFGGGRTGAEARRGIVVADNGNRIAFIGCNPVGPVYAWAQGEKVPGAAPCDDDFIRAEISALRTRADVVIMTIQYQEYYRYKPTTDQIVFFNKYAKMGADMVIGSQAHQPQSFAFTGDTFIHYGLGNLFFDQMNNIATRQLFADKFIIYDGRLISTVLFTGLIEDYSRPRPMTADERSAFLSMMFEQSGW